MIVQEMNDALKENFLLNTVSVIENFRIHYLH